MMKNKKQLFFQLEKKTLSLFHSESRSLLALDARNVQNMINARMNDNDNDNDDNDDDDGDDGNNDGSGGIVVVLANGRSAGEGHCRVLLLPP